MINIAIRATYYIFCCRNRNWDSPDLMQFWFFFFWLLFCFVFVLFFLIIQSQAAFVNCLYVARFTIVHSKTQIKFPILLLLSIFMVDPIEVITLLCMKSSEGSLNNYSLNGILVKKNESGACEKREKRICQKQRESRGIHNPIVE